MSDSSSQKTDRGLNPSTEPTFEQLKKEFAENYRQYCYAFFAATDLTEKEKEWKQKGQESSLYNSLWRKKLEIYEISEPHRKMMMKDGDIYTLTPSQLWKTATDFETLIDELLEIQFITKKTIEKGMLAPL